MNSQAEKENENRIRKALDALTKGFQNFIKSKPRAGKDSYKIVDMYNPDGFNAPPVRVVSLSDEKAEKLALICVNMANAMLWLYYHRKQFADIEFPTSEDIGVGEYIMRVQHDLDDVDGALFLPVWNRLAMCIAYDCQPDAFEGDEAQESVNFINTYLMLYAYMRSLKDGTEIKQLVNNADSDVERIGNLAYYLFNDTLENYYYNKAD